MVDDRNMGLGIANLPFACRKEMVLAYQDPDMSHFEIAGDKRISRHLSNFLPELTEDYFQVADQGFCGLGYGLG
jgi:hypothetical protein